MKRFFELPNDTFRGDEYDPKFDWGIDSIIGDDRGRLKMKSWDHTQYTEDPKITIQRTRKQVSIVNDQHDLKILPSLPIVGSKISLSGSLAMDLEPTGYNLKMRLSTHTIVTYDTRDPFPSIEPRDRN